MSKHLNTFFKLNEKGQTPKSEFDLEELDSQHHLATISGFTRSSGMRGSSKRYYRPTKAEDYNNAFAHLLVRIDPPYKAHDLLEHHLRYFTKEKSGDKGLFLKHVRYVILPIIRKRKNGEVHVELVEKWLEEKDKQTNFFNFLELKPNFMGLGVNLNEIFNSLRGDKK